MDDFQAFPCQIACHINRYDVGSSESQDIRACYPVFVMYTKLELGGEGFITKL